MGCESSAFDEAIHEYEFRQFIKHFQTIQLDESEVRKLFHLFHEIDDEGNGNLDLNDMLMYLEVIKTGFSERIFSIFDYNLSKKIDFQGFVLSIWNFCTLTHNTLDFFAFDLYDKDHSGELSIDEVLQMLQNLYGKFDIKNNPHAKHVIKELNLLRKTKESLNSSEFKTFAMTHQALLNPAFQIQSALRRKILGSGFWEQHTENRIRMTEGKYVPVRDFLLKASTATTAASGTLHRSVCDGSAAGSKATNHSRHKSIVKGKKRHLLVASNSNISASSDSTFASLQSMHGMFASNFRSAPHSPVKVYVSPSSSLATSDVKGFTSGSKSGSAAAGITSPFVSPRQPGQREGNRRFSKEDLHDGHILNPKLAVSGLGKIEGHSPFEAWSDEPSPGHCASPYGTHNSSMVELFDASDVLEVQCIAKKRHSSAVHTTAAISTGSTDIHNPSYLSKHQHLQHNGNYKRRGFLY